MIGLDAASTAAEICRLAFSLSNLYAVRGIARTRECLWNCAGFGRRRFSFSDEKNTTGCAVVKQRPAFIQCLIAVAVAGIATRMSIASSSRLFVRGPSVSSRLSR